METPLHKKNQISKLIFDIGLEVQKPTQALKLVKGPGNTIDRHLKWARTLPSLIFFSWDFYIDPPSIKFLSNIKVDI